MCKKTMEGFKLGGLDRVMSVKTLILFLRERLNLGLACARDNGDTTRPRLNTHICSRSCKPIKDAPEKSLFGSLQFS